MKNRYQNEFWQVKLNQAATSTDVQVVAWLQASQVTEFSSKMKTKAINHSYVRLRCAVQLSIVELYKSHFKPQIFCCKNENTF